MLKGEKKVFLDYQNPQVVAIRPGRFKQKAVRDGNDHWVLNGTKLWISGADRADYGLDFCPNGRRVDRELQLLLLKPTGQGLTSLGSFIRCVQLNMLLRYILKIFASPMKIF